MPPFLDCDSKNFWGRNSCRAQTYGLLSSPHPLPFEESIAINFSNGSPRTCLSGTQSCDLGAEENMLGYSQDPCFRYPRKRGSKVIKNNVQWESWFGDQDSLGANPFRYTGVRCTQTPLEVLLRLMFPTLTSGRDPVGRTPSSRKFMYLCTDTRSFLGAVIGEARRLSSHMAHTPPAPV